MKRFAAALLAAALVGCTSLTAFQSPTGALVQAGMTKDQVRAAWGEPTRVASTANAPRGMFLTTDTWAYDFAAVYFVQGNVVQKIVPVTAGADRYPGNLGPASNQAGAGR